jgi:hypothetical protein
MNFIKATVFARKRGLRMSDWPLWILSLVTIGAPTGALMLDRMGKMTAPRFFKRQGLPALVVFLIVAAYVAYTGNPLTSLIVWGLVGGLLGTVTLDIVRLLGVSIGAFPMDMPKMFGSMALGSAPYLPKHVMASMVAMLSKMPGESRKNMMQERISAMAKMPPRERKMFVSMIYNGMMKLPEQDRQAVMKTQIEIVSALPQDERMAMMEAMDEAMTGGVSMNPPPNPVPAFRAGLMPRIPMGIFRKLVDRALPAAAKEKDLTMGRVVLTGYLWHFVNGATYGIAYTLLFGRGSWLLALGWGTFVWLVMMASMPKMMPMVQLPYPKFMVIPLLAHWAMIIPIGYFALTFITPAASAGSFFGFLLK